MSDTITAIDPLPSDPNVLRVRVDRRIVARLSRADVEELELAEGQRWTAARAAAVQRAVASAKTRKAALAMLGRRALSRGELVRRLEGRGHERAIVRKVAEQLESDGWIDDHAYARSICHELTRRKPASAELLTQKLHSHLISKDVAATVVREVSAETNPQEAAVEFARKTMRRISGAKPLSRAAVVRRVAGALARRGFDEQTVEHTLAEIGLLNGDD